MSDSVLQALEKYGAPTTALSDVVDYNDAGLYVSTGSFSIDYCIGRPGIPVGKIVELYGAENTTKSSVLMSVAASVCEQGGTSILLDAEGSCSRDWANIFSLDPERHKFFVQYPESFESALEVMETVIRASAETGELVFIGLDSIPAIACRKQMEADLDDEKYIGLKARRLTSFTSKVTNILHNSRCIVMFCNQLKQSIDIMAPGQGGGSSKKPKQGGKTLDFSSMLLLMVKRVRKEDTHTVVRMRGDKNKICVDAEYRTVDYKYVYQSGIDDSLTVAKVGEDMGLIAKVAGNRVTWVADPEHKKYYVSQMPGWWYTVIMRLVFGLDYSLLLSYPEPPEGMDVVHNANSA